jgi:putative membrane protein insertion efficiency factor
MKHLMIGLINLYRKFISPIKPPCCRFTPTCSAYALEAFKKRGFFVGFILTTWRILRCNPFSKGGYDPVPEKGFRRRPDSRQTEDVATNADGRSADCHTGCSASAQEITQEKEQQN